MVKCEHCHGEHDTSQRFCSLTGKLFAAERFFPPGMVLDGKYRLGALIGAGGMGAVIEGTHILLDKTVAIKLLLPDFAGNPEMSARLQREARAASGSGHRNITMVTDLGRTSEGTLYVVMERLTGRSLDLVLRDEAPLDVTRAAHIVCEVLSGLDAVHRRGIVHRDLKPSNVMLCIQDDGVDVIKILDFGISKEIGGDDLTTMGRVMGTPRYMPPEQARGLPDIDQRADIYACGAILYALLTAEPPVPGTNYNAVIAAILEGKVEAPSKKVPNIPAKIDQIVLRAMASERQQRFPDALAFRRELLPFCPEERRASTELGVGRAGRSPDRYEELGSPRSAPVDSSSLELVDLDQRGASSRGPTGPRPAAACGASVRGDPSVEEAPPPTGVQLSRPSALRASPPRTAPAPAPAPAPARVAPAPAAVAPLAVDVRPGAPGVPTELGPQDDDAPLELAEPLRPVSVQPEPPAKPGTVYSRGAAVPWRLLRNLLLLVVLVAAAGVAWIYRENLRSAVTGAPSADPADQVMILVDTEPPGAEVFIDGVFQVMRPVPLPKSGKRFELKVQAKGYLTEVQELIPDRTKVIRVVLRRRAR
jgi:eukaryotic-like serine/threonine-protein kinase